MSSRATFRLVFCCCWAALAVAAEVCSLTVGITVNSPYGLSEPWVLIREALLHVPQVQSVAEQPDIKSATASIKTKNGDLITWSELDDAIRGAGAGAHLRSVEAVINGELEKSDDKLWLRLKPDGQKILVQPLTELVQWDEQRNAPRLSLLSERQAYEALLKKVPQQTVQIVGPLRWSDNSKLAAQIEVRSFKAVQDAK